MTEPTAAPTKPEPSKGGGWLVPFLVGVGASLTVHLVIRAIERSRARDRWESLRSGEPRMLLPQVSSPYLERRFDPAAAESAWDFVE